MRMKNLSIRLLILSILVIVPQFSQGKMVKNELTLPHSKLDLETKPSQKLTFKQKLVKKWVERKIKKQTKEGKLSAGLKSLIWGSLACLSFFLFGSLYGSIIMVFTLLAGLNAVRLGIKAVKNDDDKKLAIFGLILGSVSALTVLAVGLFYLSVYFAF